MKPFLFLIGYRGCGKSTVGRLLAGRLGCAFIDSDERIEQAAGRSIREIFAAEGEAGFRRREHEALAEICRGGPAIVATGGGIVLREENRRLLRECGYVVWLDAPAEVLWRRIEGDATTASRRPNLAGGGRAEVERLLAVRTPLYRQCADLTVSVEWLSPEQVADAILAAWGPPPSST